MLEGRVIFRPDSTWSGIVARVRFVSLTDCHGRSATGQKQTLKNIEHTPMVNRFLLILLFLFAAQAAASDDPLASLKAGQPGDVKKLIDRLAGCTHWSGEEPYDAERKTEISLAMKDLRCDRLEKDEAAARKRYAKRPGVLKVLQQAKESS